MNKFITSLKIHLSSSKFRVLIITPTTPISKKEVSILHNYLKERYKTHTFVLHNNTYNTEIHIDGKSKIKFLCVNKFSKLSEADKNDYDIIISELSSIKT